MEGTIRYYSPTASMETLRQNVETALALTMEKRSSDFFYGTYFVVETANCEMRIYSDPDLARALGLVHLLGRSLAVIVLSGQALSEMSLQLAEVSPELVQYDSNVNA